MDILSSLLPLNPTHKKDFEKVIWFVNILKWVQRPRSEDEKTTKIETVYTVRIKYLLSMLKNNPEWLNNFVTTISSLLYEISGVAQFVSVGFSTSSFINEFAHRIQEKLIPNKPFHEDLETLIFEIFPNENESIYVDFIDETILAELLTLFNKQFDLHKKLKNDLMSASYVLSVQILNNVFAIQEDLKYFFKKPEEFAEFKLEGLLRVQQILETFEVRAEVFELLGQIESNIEELELFMQDRGVKIQLVYLFQVQRRKLNRLRILLGFLSPEISNAASFRLFLSQLILDTHHQKSFKSFVKDNLSLLTDRIVQANSHVGEHYVTFTWHDFQNMFKSAVGGGAVTGLTVFVKIGLGRLGFTGFLKGLFETLNYSASFLTIQVMGWTLATKQPSNTAPYIAKELTKSTAEARRSIVALLRTQFIAVMGNLSMVFPFCFLISLISLRLGNPVVGVDKSLEMINSTNLAGPSIIFAVFTGFLLFMASLIAGWFENWVVVNQLGKRLKHNQFLKAYFGSARTSRFANFFTTNSNSLAANISLGFLLGMLPQFIKFLGVPLEVRHVTLATGAFATALPMVLSIGLTGWEILNPILGILCIGLLNISVSFFLAFLLASVSSKVKFRSLLPVLKSAVLLILKKPWLLFIPEKD